jgi:hypothetical protein
VPARCRARAPPHPTATAPPSPSLNPPLPPRLGLLPFHHHAPPFLSGTRTPRTGAACVGLHAHTRAQNPILPSEGTAGQRKIVAHPPIFAMQRSSASVRTSPCHRSRPAAEWRAHGGAGTASPTDRHQHGPGRTRPHRPTPSRLPRHLTVLEGVGRPALGPNRHRVRRAPGRGLGIGPLGRGMESAQRGAHAGPRGPGRFPCGHDAARPAAARGRARPVGPRRAQRRRPAARTRVRAPRNRPGPFRITAKPATRLGRRAGLGTHGPDRTAGLIHRAIGDSSPTRRVGPHRFSNCQAGGLIASLSRERSCGGPISRSGHVLMPS